MFNVCSDKMNPIFNPDAIEEMKYRSKFILPKLTDLPKTADFIHFKNQVLHYNPIMLDKNLDFLSKFLLYRFCSPEQLYYWSGILNSKEKIRRRTSPLTDKEIKSNLEEFAHYTYMTPNIFAVLLLITKYYGNTTKQIRYINNLKSKKEEEEEQEEEEEIEDDTEIIINEKNEEQNYKNILEIFTEKYTFKKNQKIQWLKEEKENPIPFYKKRNPIEYENKERLLDIIDFTSSLKVPPEIFKNLQKPTTQVIKFIFLNKLYYTDDIDARIYDNSHEQFYTKPMYQEIFNKLLQTNLDYNFSIEYTRAYNILNEDYIYPYNRFAEYSVLYLQDSKYLLPNNDIKNPKNFRVKPLYRFIPKNYKELIYGCLLTYYTKTQIMSTHDNRFDISNAEYLLEYPFRQSVTCDPIYYKTEKKIYMDPLNFNILMNYTLSKGNQIYLNTNERLLMIIGIIAFDSLDYTEMTFDISKNQITKSLLFLFASQLHITPIVGIEQEELLSNPTSILYQVKKL